MSGDKNFSNEKLNDNLDSEQAGSQQSFQIRPHLDEKFRPQAVKEVVQNALSEHLNGKIYSNEDVEYLTKNIAFDVRNQVKDMNFSRYRFVIQIMLGEQRGAGVKMGARCMWDSDADSYVSVEYENDSLFCVAAVFAVYTY